jgi:SPP1 family predicted phage head-tail adaptor
MRAGRLRHRVEIWSKTTTRNDYGEAVEVWASTETVWGELTPLMTGTREAFAAQVDQVVAAVAWQVRMRHRQLSPAMNRLRVGGREFDVQAVMDPDGRGAELVVLCREVQR